VTKITEDKKVARQRGKRRRQEIIDSAAQVFYEKGYEAASTQDIADLVGILKGSLYYYVESKEDFLFEVIKEVNNAALGVLGRVQASAGGPAEKLAALGRAHLEFYFANRIKATVFFRELDALAPERRKELHGVTHMYRVFIAELITFGQAQGVVNPRLDPPVTALAIVEMLNSVSRWYDPEGPASSALIIEQFLAILLEGMTVPVGDQVSAAAAGSAS
jgi:AcrR family transcriptional regulator